METKTDINSQVFGAVLSSAKSYDDAREILNQFLKENGAPVAYFLHDESDWVGEVYGTVDIEIFRADMTVVEITEEMYRREKDRLDAQELGLL